MEPIWQDSWLRSQKWVLLQYEALQLRHGSYQEAQWRVQNLNRLPEWQGSKQNTYISEFYLWPNSFENMEAGAGGEHTSWKDVWMKMYLPCWSGSRTQNFPGQTLRISSPSGTFCQIESHWLLPPATCRTTRRSQAADHQCRWQPGRHKHFYW